MVTRMSAQASAETARSRLTRKSAAYWEVTFNNPPLNIVGPAEVRDLVKILDEIEADPKVKVVVFDSAVPDYFMAHYDLLKPLKDSTGMEPGPTGMHPVPDFMVRLSRLKAVTIVPGGGPMARLPRLVGRGRAIEILIGADDFNGELAERYGYVNRALPDAELDGIVDALAIRIASFDKHVIADTKKLLDVACMPPDAEMQPGWNAFITSVQRPAAQARVKALIEKGLGQPGDVERHLGQYTAKYKE
jgi:enoyl-CoA hydratase/carnithine racemase